MQSCVLRVLAILTIALAAFGAAAQSNQRQEVDVELVLAVDISRSMQPFELDIQRNGYAEALQSDAVWSAIQRGLLQRIALTYVEWAGPGTQRTVLPWTLIETRADLARAADRIAFHNAGSLRYTSISSALAFAREALDTNAFEGLRRVIDVSGDGPNNSGRFVTIERDRTIARGITINGLPLMTYDPDEIFSRWGIPDLDRYYTNCVIGGPGAFVIPVTEWDQFADAVRRKLVLEIAGVQPVRLWRAQVDSDYNCRIGEEIRRRNDLIFGEP